MVKRTRPRELKAEQRAVIAAMLSGASINKVVESTGVPRNTLWKWRNNDELFREEYDQAYKDLLSEATDDIRSAARDAVSTLRRLLVEGQPTHQLQAALAILEIALNRVPGRVGGSSSASDGLEPVDELLIVRRPADTENPFNAPPVD